MEYSYLERDYTEGDERIEHLRARGDIDMIIARSDDADLVEDRPIHRICETPKIASKQGKTMKLRDEALRLLRKLNTESAETLRKETYEYSSSKWMYTNRASEMKLIRHVLLNPNARPRYFSILSQRLCNSDVSQLILDSLCAPLQCRGQSVARFNIHTIEEIGLKTLWQILKELKEANNGFEISNEFVVATLIDIVKVREGVSVPKITHPLSTKQLDEYIVIEDYLEKGKQLMSSRTTLTCSIRGKPHVQTQIAFFNNGSSITDTTRRTKYIEVKQTVKCLNRRILIDDVPNASFDVEVDNDLVPTTVPVDNDLIKYLLERE